MRRRPLEGASSETKSSEEMQTIKMTGMITYDVSFVGIVACLVLRSAVTLPFSLTLFARIAWCRAAFLLNPTRDIAYRLEISDTSTHFSLHSTQQSSSKSFETASYKSTTAFRNDLQ